ncbi:MAG: bifunctional phosphoglucose/phosphomannose isomerase [Candidatus Moranbacteria bacterium]|nr:bifunctional phosphoglucose/phosphomannose isomerase [Candidatus Moranbacteria bacterium]
MQENLDPSDFRKMILGSPDQFAEGMRLAGDVRFSSNPGYRSIMISGMGGSALPGNIFRIYLSDLVRRGLLAEPISIYQNRFYELPWEARRSLNVFASYSGNTEETIESLQSAIAEKLPSIGISSGGKIEEICIREGIPYIKLPIPYPDFQPRLGTGYFFGALYQVLVNEGLAPDMRDEIGNGAEYLRTRLAALEESGKALSAKCEGKTPVIYASPRYKSVAMVWKIKFNENSKTAAFWNFFPELNHNEMVGYTHPSGPFQVIMLRDSEDHPKDLKRFDVTAGLLREQGISVEMLDMEGENVFNRVFSSLLLADFTSYHLALAYGIDPTPVVLVEKLKRMLT